MINVKNEYGFGIGNYDNVLKTAGKTSGYEARNLIDIDNNIIIIAMTNKEYYFKKFFQDVEKNTYESLVNK